MLITKTTYSTFYGTPRATGFVACLALIAAVGVSPTQAARAGDQHTETRLHIVPPVTRTYYIAADEVEWDYAPTGTNLIEGRPFNANEKAFMEAGPTVIGRKAMKALYREYTDGSFTTLKARPPEWEHLGYLGPLIRAQVGDTIRVVFKNNVKFPASVHPHGLFYKKSAEGAPYNDGTSGAEKSDDIVQPGCTFTYIWEVPERAGPTEHEGSSTISMYHSHVDEVRDIASGLIGPIIITRRGMAREDGSPIDVDREFVAGFMEIDENSSWYVEDNIHKYATQPDKVQVVMGPFFLRMARPSFDKYYRETINGFTYGHTPGFTMKVGEHVRWYLMASTDQEIHSPHWHGNSVVINHMRTDVAMLLSMGMQVADMVPDNPGKWLFHCHVANHLNMGMEAFYVVEPASPEHQVSAAAPKHIAKQ
ncbi:MAG TPA: multicopper oxidase domain-containing protein [Bryobacteraceae bacterium]|nr:multicopper oxidase domain-containing protein [Bryobacteraceae bacterium]